MASEIEESDHEESENDEADVPPPLPPQLPPQLPPLPAVELTQTQQRHRRNAAIIAMLKQQVLTLTKTRTDANDPAEDMDDFHMPDDPEGIMTDAEKAARHKTLSEVHDLAAPINLAPAPGNNPAPAPAPAPAAAPAPAPVPIAAGLRTDVEEV
jgi:hypothetical protein